MPSSMAKETLNSRTVAQEEEEEEDEEEEEERDAINISNNTSSSPRDWLQLGLATAAPLSLHLVAGRRPSASDLELLGERPSSSSSSSSSSSAVLARSHPLLSRRPWEISWNSTEMLREMSTTPTPPRSWAVAGSSSSSRRNSSSMRVVSPPRRRSSQTGVWFTLQAAQNCRGRGSLLLPQITPRNYLRTSEGTLTVGWVMRYLVSKLGLEDESQVEITCRDHLLPPFWTLQYVRENIWCSGDAPAIFPTSPTTVHHVMTLHYRRSMSS